MTALLAILLAAPAQSEHAARAAAMVSYVSADYGAAVGPSGELLTPAEFEEQKTFLREVADELRTAGAPELARLADRLHQRVSARARPPEVIAAARELETRIEQRFRLSVLPPRAPSLARGRALYAQACAACHGVGGTPTGRLQLSTVPPDFAAKDGIARIAPRRAFAAVTFGVPGTAMPAFGDTVSEPDRWDVAWYLVSLAHGDPAERARGEALLARFPRRPDYLQLATRSDDQLRMVLSGMPLSAADREAILSAIRASAP